MAGDQLSEKDRGQATALDALDVSRQAVKREHNPIEWMCCDCAKFGPWGDGKYRYCEDHVPDDLRNADRAFKKRLEKAP